MAYVHHQNVWRAVGRGATVGGVTGFFACLGAPELGAGFLGSAARGAVGGAVGDTYGQATAIAFGWQDCFNWPEVLASAAFGGTVGGLSNVIGGAGGAVPESDGCFTAQVPMTMKDGSSRAICKVKKNDFVLAKDPVSGKVAAKRVLRTFVRWVNETLVLTFANGERIETTANHPFRVEGKGFLAAGKLGIGTLVVTRAGPATKLVKRERKRGRVRVYNLEVEGFHSYIVGTGGGALWVHNNALCTFYHGTDVGSARSLLGGADLAATIAGAMNQGGDVGCYLAHDPDAAWFFASRRPPSLGGCTVLQYGITSDALAQLKAAGAESRPVPFGGRGQGFDLGHELYIPSGAFDLFNQLRAGGHILIGPG